MQRERRLRVVEAALKTMVESIGKKTPSEHIVKYGKTM